MRAVRSRRRAHGALAALTVCGMLALTGCQGDGESAGGAPGSTPGATPPGSPSAPPTAAAPTPAKSAPKPSASATTPAKKPVPSPPKPSCASVGPESTDTIALYRYTPEGGSYNLIVKHGAWTCDGAKGAAHGETFVPMGEETYIPIAETAKITATAPILSGPSSHPVTTHELTEWLVAHPNRALPFKYHLGAGGVIDTLDEIYVLP